MKEKKIDFIVFAGQSNMAGRGDASKAPHVTEGSAYEFRAVTKPDQLFPVVEPFGQFENVEGGINDTGRKSGSMVSACLKTYFEQTGRIAVGMSASEGGTSIIFWRPEGPAFADLKNRCERAFSYFKEQEIEVQRRIFVWMQGETDGDHGMSKEEYEARLTSFLQAVRELGLEELYLIPIGAYNGTDTTICYDAIREAQKELCEKKQAICAGNLAYTYQARGLMKDAFHYVQEAYNEMGEELGRIVGVRSTEQSVESYN